LIEPLLKALEVDELYCSTTVAWLDEGVLRIGVGRETNVTGLIRLFLKN
jgi:hypothetical protein